MIISLFDCAVLFGIYFWVVHIKCTKGMYRQLLKVIMKNNIFQNMILMNDQINKVWGKSNSKYFFPTVGGECRIKLFASFSFA